MKEVSGYNISEQEFKKISKWAEDVYNIAVVIDYFVGNQPEIEECYNLAPVVKNLRKNADLLNALFIDNENANIKESKKLFKTFLTPFNFNFYNQL